MKVVMKNISLAFALFVALLPSVLARWCQCVGLLTHLPEQKDDRREFQIGSFGGMMSGRIGVKRDKLIPVQDQHIATFYPARSEFRR
jgi:hypothetical protein